MCNYKRLKTMVIDHQKTTKELETQVYEFIAKSDVKVKDLHELINLHYIQYHRRLRTKNFSHEELIKLLDYINGINEVKRRLQPG